MIKALPAIAILLLSAAFAAAQVVCRDSGMTIRYLTNREQINIRNQNPTPGSGILNTGYVLYNNTLSPTNGFVTRLDAAKKIAWSKEISSGDPNIGIDIFEAKQFSDGNIVAVGIRRNMITNNRRVALYKFSPAGNLLWEKYIDSTNSYAGELYLYFDGLDEGVNNDILFAFHQFKEAAGDFCYTTIMRVNAAAALVWQRTYSNSYLLQPSQVLVPNISNIGTMQVLGDSLVCFGAGPKETIIFKLGYNDGRPGKSRYSKYTYTTSSTFVASEKYFTTNVVKGKYYSFTTETEYFTPQNEMISVLFDSSLNPIRQFKMNVPGIPYSVFSGVRKNIVSTTEDTILINMPADLNNYFISLTGSGKIIQERKQLNTSFNFGYYQKNLVSGTSDALAVVVSPNPPSSPAGFELVQLQDYGKQFEDCIGVTDPHINIQQIPLDTGRYNLDKQSANDFAVYPQSSVITDIDFEREVLCKSVSICDSVKIIGPDSICKLNTPYYFHVKRRSDCLKRIDWRIDTSAVHPVQYINDSTIALSFKKEWNGYLYASISSCMLIIDSLQLFVFNSPTAIDLGNDKTACTDTGYTLNAGKGFKWYRWQDGSADSVFHVTQTGTYNVLAYDHCGNRFTDTIYIRIAPPPAINLGSDTSLCDNDFLQLDAGNGFIKYQWSTGDTTARIRAEQPAIYTVWAMNANACIATDTLRIENLYPAPKPLLDKRPDLCLGENNILDAGPGYTQYKWNDGSIVQRITVTHTGKYRVKVTAANGCSGADSVNIRRLVPVPTNFLFSDTIICPGAAIELKASRPFRNYSWSNGSLSPSVRITSPGDYRLRVTDALGCTGIDTITVSNRDCPGIFYMPNSFTPNKDGLNDVLKPFIDGVLQQYSLSIFNQWGQLVFRSNNIQQGWDGYFKNIQQEAGAYVWLCTYRLLNGDLQQRKGAVVLVR